LHSCRTSLKDNNYTKRVSDRVMIGLKEQIDSR
jgi:hypothetical protein